MPLQLTHLRKRALWLPPLVLTILFALELSSAFAMTDRHLVYTLDDAYIHLAMAENIVRGHYGVNLGEFSAPSSSVVWPFLLAPFSRLPFGAYVPLVINLCAALATVYLFSLIIGRSVPEDALVCVIVILLIPTTNLIGLIFTGMEHSLQVFLGVLLILGLIREQETGRVPWWLAATIVCGPLVRYENLALTLPALLYLAIRGRYQTVLLSGLSLAATLGGFSWFLYSRGLGLFPSSVVVKSTVVSGRGKIAAITSNLNNNLIVRQGAILSIGLLILLAVCVDRRRRRDDRLLAGWAATSLALHFLLGSFGAYSRYEIYVWTVVLITALYLYGDRLTRYLEGVHLKNVVMMLTVCALTIGLPPASKLGTTPLASRNIYAQQYQMHRYITEYWNAPVAVNDLGWTSFRNDDYVLDLGGLGSLAALKASRADDSTDWMDSLARKHGVRLAMIYRDWFGQAPASWIPFGELRLRGRLITPASSTVTFYALDREALVRARSLALEYQKTLPSTASFIFLEQP